MTRRHPMGLVLLALSSLAAGACNLLVGVSDPVPGEADGTRDDKTHPPDTATPGPGDPLEPNDPDTSDGGSDPPQAPVTITVGKDWTTPNGADWRVTDGGTFIVGYTSSEHPVLVPKTQPAIPSDDYTVLATVFAYQKGEFGILARVQADGSAVVLGSQYGDDLKAFVGTIAPSSDPPANWSPAKIGQGPAYDSLPNTRYKLKLRAVGTQIQAKMWNATQPEPAAFQVSMVSPWATGRGVGYYNYQPQELPFAMLESLQITVP